MAISKEMFVKVIFNCKNNIFHEVLPFGFETTLFVNVSDEEEIIPEKHVAITDEKGFPIGQYRTYPAVTVPKGNFIGFTFKGANGEIYACNWIDNVIGLRPISEIFKKISVKNLELPK